MGLELGVSIVLTLHNVLRLRGPLNHPISPVDDFLHNTNWDLEVIECCADSGCIHELVHVGKPGG